MRSHASAPLLLLATLQLGAFASAQERVRFEIARFDLPAGWTRTETKDGLLLEPAEKNARIELAKSLAIEGSVDRHGETLVTAAAQRPDYRIEVPPASGRHQRSNGRWHRFVYSEANPAKAGTFVYTAALSVGASGRCVTFRMISDTTAAYEQHREALGKMVDSVELTTSERLERGSPPLSRYMVDEVTSFLEWLVQSPMTEDQRATVESELRRFWKEKAEDEIAGTKEILAGRAELAKLPEAQRELARHTVLEEALAQWQKDKEDPAAAMMLAIYNASHQPIAAGEPPLTAQAVNAFAEYLNFAAGQCVGYEGRLPKSVCEELGKGVAESYGTLPKEQRETIAGMPMVWAALRVAWPDLPAARKQAMIDGWKQQESIAALGKALLAQKAAADDARATAEMIRDTNMRQMQMRAQQMQFNAMQNILRMQSDTQRIIMSNLGGNTRYEYRW
jgi:hypothetical protein